MQLGLTHRAFETQKEPIVEMTGIVDPVFIEDERVREGADLQEAVPVGGVAGQPRYFQPHDQADTTESDLSD